MYKFVALSTVINTFLICQYIKLSERVTTHVLNEMKLKGEKIAMLTAYDYSIARILDEAEIDVILVGDSASNVMAGFETTLPITLDNMIYHAASVVRGVKRALVVVDLPSELTREIQRRLLLRQSGL